MPDPLMRPGLVKVERIPVEYTMELLLLEDKQMIETLATHTSEKAFTHGIRSRGVIRDFENLDPTRLPNTGEVHPKLAIVITDEILRSLSIGGGFSNRYVRPKRRWDIV